MNVIIIGGGAKKRWGNYLAERYKTEGHRVKILSHGALPGTPDHLMANFTDSKDVREKFLSLTQDLDCIDLLVYNSSASCRCDSPDFFKGVEASEDSWIQSYKVHVTVPYMIVSQSLPKMKQDSRVIFMSTAMMTGFQRTEHTAFAGYAGGKSSQAHMMLAFAHHNSRGVNVVGISPFFNYQSPDHLVIFDKCYDFINSIGPEHNGKIYNFFK